MKKFAAVFILLLLAKWWFTDPTVSVPTNDITFSYVVKYTYVSNSSDRLPMLVALHGNGDTTENFYKTALNNLTVPVRIILLEGPFSKGTGHAWPWTASDFKKYGVAVNEAIEQLSLKYPTKHKPILLGFSGGAMMAYYQAINHGNNYSYIYPVSGRLSTDLLGDNSAKPGAIVHAFHGKDDKVVSISGAREAVKILKSVGGNVSFTEFKGGHLGIFTSMKTKITNSVEQKIMSLN